MMEINDLLFLAAASIYAGAGRSGFSTEKEAREYAIRQAKLLLQDVLEGK